MSYSSGHNFDCSYIACHKVSHSDKTYWSFSLLHYIQPRPATIIHRSFGHCYFKCPVRCTVIIHAFSLYFVWYFSSLPRSGSIPVILVPLERVQSQKPSIWFPECPATQYRINLFIYAITLSSSMHSQANHYDTFVFGKCCLPVCENIEPLMSLRPQVNVPCRIKINSARKTDVYIYLAGSYNRNSTSAIYLCSRPMFNYNPSIYQLGPSGSQTEHSSPIHENYSNAWLRHHIVCEYDVC